ncbi:MAG TPA: ATP-binding protein [Phycisphaerae bacterium]|nr:ATP-binding protein [Phycisphaerae bacterium]
MAKQHRKLDRTVELENLRSRLEELEQTLDAIRSGEVDALIVNGPNGDHVYSLKGAEQPYRAFIEQMHEGAVTLDASGTVLYCNMRFAEMVGLPLEKVIGTSVLPHVAEGDRALAARMIGELGTSTANVMMAGGGWGKVFPVRFSVSPLDPGDGQEVVTRALVVTDLTEQHERKQLTEALAKLRANQKELQAQYEEVDRTRKALEAANASKDDFLAALSHELRTPLTPVLLTANALAVDPGVPAELRGDLEMIKRNVELEARLIDDLLDLTRIARGKMQISPRPADLHEILLSALDICMADTEAKRLRFVTELKAKHHWTSVETVRLQQVFWNLIRNAVKFTPGTGTITIRTRNVGAHGGKGGKAKDRGQETIVVTVEDEGIGMERDALGRIFNAFEQGSGLINRRFGGLGLGLSISRRLVELHGGRIEAASAGVGKGATLTVTLPTIGAPSRHAKKDKPAARRSGRALRILLVEDHEDTRRNMTRLLSALKHTVVAAENAAAALREAAAGRFDLVVSDIGLPDESGLELMRKLRTRHRLTGICLSGYGMEEDIARSREAGFSEHLTKPINFERLEQAIAEATRGKPGSRSGA